MEAGDMEIQVEIAPKDVAHLGNTGYFRFQGDKPEMQKMSLNMAHSIRNRAQKNASDKYTRRWAGLGATLVAAAATAAAVVLKLTAVATLLAASVLSGPAIIAIIAGAAILLGAAYVYGAHKHTSSKVEEAGQSWDEKINRGIQHENEKIRNHLREAQERRKPALDEDESDSMSARLQYEPSHARSKEPNAELESTRNKRTREEAYLKAFNRSTKIGGLTEDISIASKQNEGLQHMPDEANKSQFTADYAPRDDVREESVHGGWWNQNTYQNDLDRKE
jgi:hypothetical protein